MSSCKRTGGSCCVAIGCSMRRGTNLLSAVRMFSFPTESSRRSQWEKAVNRRNWTPSKWSTLCNLHFITGQPSTDPLHPDYVPSIFKYKNNHSSLFKVARYKRVLKRETTVENQIPDRVNTEDFISGENINCSKKRDIGTMTELSSRHIDDMQEMNKSLLHHCRKLQSSSTSTSKTTDKNCGPPYKHYL